MSFLSTSPNLPYYPTEANERLVGNCTELTTPECQLIVPPATNTGDSSDSASSLTIIIAAVVVGVAALIAVIVVLRVVRDRRNKNRHRPLPLIPGAQQPGLDDADQNGLPMTSMSPATRTPSERVRSHVQMREG